MRDLAISFLYTTFEHRDLPESELALYTDRLPSLFGREPDATTPAEIGGFVSMKHHGLELLGASYWIEDVQLLGLGSHVGLTGLQFELQATPHKPSDANLVNVALFERGNRLFTRTLERSTYEQEWQLMRARAERVREALGDPSGEVWLNDWHFGWPAAAAYAVPQDLRDYCRYADLGTLLANPMPS